MDFHLELSNGQLLKGVIHSPGEDPAGVIVFIHGLGEHIARYNQWADLFRKEKFAFTGLDLPGHGKSEGKRGKIKSYSMLHEMTGILLKTVSRTFPGVPVFLYGHSLGGGIVLDYIIRFNPVIRGAIISSPWIRLAFEPSKMKIILATMVQIILPGFVQPSGLDTIQLSHDKSVIEAYNHDPLIHDKISVGLFIGAMRSAKYCLQHASDLKIPSLFIHGSDDMICSPDGSREFAGMTPLAELRIFDGGFHELHNEPFKLEVFSHIINWLKIRSVRRAGVSGEQ